MLPSLIIGLIALVVIGAVFDTVFDRIIGPRVDSYRSELAKLHHVQIVLSDTEEGLLDYAMSGKLAPLERFVSGKNVIATEIEPFLPQLDKLTSTRSGANGASVLASHVFNDLQADWEKLVRLGGGLQPTQAEIAPLTATTLELSDQVKNDLGRYVDQLATVTAQTDALSNLENRLLADINIGCAIFAIIAMIYAFRNILRALDSGLLAKKQVDQLFLMTDMLQSAAGQDDTNEVLRSNSAALMPGFGGALYVFNNSRDRLDLSTSWGEFAEGSGDDSAQPPAGR